MTHYKLLDAGRRSPVAGVVWPRVGTWTKPAAETVLCNSGWHLCTLGGIPEWVRGGRTLYEAEGEEPGASDVGKQTFTRARLTREVGVLTRSVLVQWAADCAEHVLPIFEAQCPGDDRPRRAIDAARSGNGAAVYAYAAAAYAASADAYAAAAYAAAAAASSSSYAAAAAYAAADTAAADAYAYAAAAADAVYAYAAAAYAACFAEREWQGTALLRRLEATP